jgi:hypothetical protein
MDQQRVPGKFNVYLINNNRFYCWESSTTKNPMKSSKTTWQCIQLPPEQSLLLKLKKK